jgi:hypothetical protein
LHKSQDDDQVGTAIRLANCLQDLGCEFGVHLRADRHCDV